MIGDEAGAISFWAIAYEPTPQARFLGMPKHASMPPLATGAQLLNCQMSAMSRRLLEQNGADVTGVRVVNEVAPVMEEKVPATPSKNLLLCLLHNPFDT